MRSDSISNIMIGIIPNAMKELFSKTDATKKVIIFAYEDDWITLKNGNLIRFSCNLWIGTQRGAF